MSKNPPVHKGATAVFRVKCPVCGTATVYSPKNPFRPFCGQICKTGDLAAWASDEYRVPGQTVMNHDDDQSSGGDDQEY